MSNICPSCGYEAQDNEKFCAACGTKLEAPQQPVSEQPDAVYGATDNAQPEPVNSIPQYQDQQYTAPQNGAPQYQNQQYAAPQYGPGAPAPKKKKTALIVALIIGGVVIIAGIIAVIISTIPSGSGSKTSLFGNGINLFTSDSDLDGEYKLTGMYVDGQDYSTLLSFIDDDYHLTINGSECTLNIGGEEIKLNIDKAGKTLYSLGLDDTVDFSIDGDTITIGIDGTEMIFTKE